MKPKVPDGTFIGAWRQGKVVWSYRGYRYHREVSLVMSKPKEVAFKIRDGQVVESSIVALSNPTGVWFTGEEITW